MLVRWPETISSSVNDIAVCGEIFSPMIPQFSECGRQPSIRVDTGHSPCMQNRPLISRRRPDISFVSSCKADSSGCHQFVLHTANGSQIPNPRLLEPRHMIYLHKRHNLAVNVSNRESITNNLTQSLSLKLTLRLDKEDLKRIPFYWSNV
jgi:hypothetical protein